jgi:hypothetical protein
VAESEDFGGEGGPRGSEGNQGGEKEPDHREHPGKIPGGRASEGAPAPITETLSRRKGYGVPYTRGWHSGEAQVQPFTHKEPYIES